MQGEDLYVEDSDEEDTWPRLAIPTRETPRENPRVPTRGKDTPRGFKPAPAKYVIKREPASQPRGAPQVPGSALKQLLAMPKKRERTEREAIEDSESQEDLGPPPTRRDTGGVSPQATGLSTVGVLEGRGQAAPTPNRTVFGNYGEGGRGDAGEDARVSGGLAGVAGLAAANAARARGFATPEGFATPKASRLGGMRGGEGTPASAQRQFLASVLPTVGSKPMLSSARRVSPRKGLGPLGTQLHQQLALQQERAVVEGGRGGHLTFQVLATAKDGSVLRVVCRPDPGQGGEGTLAEIVLFLKTDPMLEVGPGERVWVGQPWQAMDLSGARIILARNAAVIGPGGQGRV